jgi:hypothetical protein
MSETKVNLRRMISEPEVDLGFSDLVIRDVLKQLHKAHPDVCEVRILISVEGRVVSP